MKLAAALPGYTAAPGRSPAALVVVVVLHLLLLWALLRLNVITLPAPLAVLEVALLPSAVPELPKPQIVPPRPRPVARQPEPQPPQAPVQLALPEAAPAPAAAVAPAPTPLAVPAPVAAPPSPAQPRPPRFDADYLDNPKPPYPAISRRMGEQGRVVLHVRVDAHGLPTNVALHASSGSDRLDASALNTVRRWKFVPARLGSEAVAAEVLVPIVFSLKD